MTDERLPRDLLDNRRRRRQAPRRRTKPDPDPRTGRGGGRRRVPRLRTAPCRPHAGPRPVRGARAAYAAGRQRHHRPRTGSAHRLVDDRIGPAAVRPRTARPPDRGGGSRRAPRQDPSRFHRQPVGPRPLGQRVRRAVHRSDAGTRIGLEFLPWSNIKTVHDGLKLVHDADTTTGGLLIDIWHTERAHTPPGDLATVPLHYIVGVELNDADAEPIGTLFEDTIYRRRLCGEGAFDLSDFIAALRTAGWHGPWGVEILSTQHRGTPLREAVAAAYRTARATLDSRSTS